MPDISYVCLPSVYHRASDNSGKETEPKFTLVQRKLNLCIVFAWYKFPTSYLKTVQIYNGKIIHNTNYELCLWNITLVHMD